MIINKKLITKSIIFRIIIVLSAILILLLTSFILAYKTSNEYFDKPKDKLVLKYVSIFCLTNLPDNENKLSIGWRLNYNTTQDTGRINDNDGVDLYISFFGKILTTNPRHLNQILFNHRLRNKTE